MIDRNALVAGLLLAVMYVAGLVSGIVVERLVQPDASGAIAAWPPPPGSVRGMRLPGLPPGIGPDRGRDLGAQRIGAMAQPGSFSAVALAFQLDLSAEQEAEVREIIERRQIAMRQIMAGMLPEMEAEFGAMDQEIRAVLTDEQREAFDDFVDAGFARFGDRNPLELRSRPRRGTPPPVR
jgi:hypothetical protein